MSDVYTLLQQPRVTEGARPGASTVPGHCCLMGHHPGLAGLCLSVFRDTHLTRGDFSGAVCKITQHVLLNPFGWDTDVRLFLGVRRELAAGAGGGCRFSKARRAPGSVF